VLLERRPADTQDESQGQRAHWDSGEE
jgi:hypothetical protein